MTSISKAKDIHGINVVRGSLVDQEVDIIVNAANRQLRGGGGIDGLIHKLAGPNLLSYLESVYPNGIETSGTAVTPGFKLKQPTIIHTAGPIWNGGDQDEPGQLDACYYNSCYVAGLLDAKSLAFASISTGIYGYPIELAIPVAVYAIVAALEDFNLDIDVTISLFTEQEFQAYENFYSSL